MTYQINISPSALKDIENIYEWIKVDAPHHATVWFNGLFSVIDSLESMPFRTPIAPESMIVDREIRCLLYRKRYRILYEVVESAINIYHVRHSSQQFLAKELFLFSTSK